MTHKRVNNHIVWADHLPIQAPGDEYIENQHTAQGTKKLQFLACPLRTVQLTPGKITLSNLNLKLTLTEEKRVSVS